MQVWVLNKAWDRADIPLGLLADKAEVSMWPRYLCPAHGYRGTAAGPESAVMERQSTRIWVGPAPAPPPSRKPQESWGEGPTDLPVASDLRWRPFLFLKFMALPREAALLQPCALPKVLASLAVPSRPHSAGPDHFCAFSARLPYLLIHSTQFESMLVSSGTPAVLPSQRTSPLQDLLEA